MLAIKEAYKIDTIRAVKVVTFPTNDDANWPESAALLVGSHNAKD